MTDANAGTRLNLGSGWHRLDGWINVDLHHDADVKEDLRTFDCPDGSIDEILSTHVIEHFTHADGVSLIGRCFRWLRPGGRLVIETPDRGKCYRLINRGRTLEGAKGLHGGRSTDKRVWHELLIAWAERGGEFVIPAEFNLPGEAHLCVWTGSELAEAFNVAGFGSVLVSSPKYHGGRHWRDVRVEGTKGIQNGVDR